jgi:undecaprenyl-diphosphatase
MWQEFDRQLFLFLNHAYHDSLSPFMLWATGDTAWLPLYLLIIVFLVWKFRVKAVAVLVVIALTITVADQFSSTFMKPTVQRLRPCYEPSLVGKVHLVTEGCGGKYGFVSSHAANTFALAMLLTLLLRKNRQQYSKTISISIFLWAFLVSYTRIYVGVHYPADVIGGALVGISVAWLFAKVAKELNVKPF